MSSVIRGKLPLSLIRYTEIGFNFMNDFLKSIKSHLYDKATSPLFGVFVLSWSAWNYKFLLVFFSSMLVDEKIDYIETFLYPGMSSCLLQGILYPLITTIIFIFLYPYPAKFVYRFTRNRQKELRKIKQEIENGILLTVEESRQLRREVLKIEIEHQSDMAKRDSEIERLKDLVNAKSARGYKIS